MDDIKQRILIECDKLGVSVLANSLGLPSSVLKNFLDGNDDYFILERFERYLEKTNEIQIESLFAEKLMNVIQTLKGKKGLHCIRVLRFSGYEYFLDELTGEDGSIVFSKILLNMPDNIVQVIDFSNNSLDKNEIIEASKSKSIVLLTTANNVNFADNYYSLPGISYDDSLKIFNSIASDELFPLTLKKQLAGTMGGHFSVLIKKVALIKSNINNGLKIDVSILE